MFVPAVVLYTTPLSVIPEKVPTVPPPVAVVSPMDVTSAVSSEELTASEKVVVEVPPPLEALTVYIFAALNAVGVPLMAPVEVLKERPAGREGVMDWHCISQLDRPAVCPAAPLSVGQTGKDVDGFAILLLLMFVPLCSASTLSPSHPAAHLFPPALPASPAPLHQALSWPTSACRVW